MNMVNSPRDLPQAMLSIIIILTLMGCAIWLLHPFLQSVVWAGFIVIATWPLFLVVQRTTGGRRYLAISLMMFFLSVIFLLPVVLSAGMLSVALERVLQWLLQIRTAHLPTLDFLTQLPVIGKHLHEKWLSFITQDTRSLLNSLKPWIIRFVTVAIQELTRFGALFINVLLTLLACLVFYVHGEVVARGLRQFAIRLAGERGDCAVLLAGKTVQAVAMGVVLTAVIQAAVAGLGLAVCHIPSSGLLTGIIFILCLMQLGPVIIMLPAVFWLFHHGQHWPGIILAAWTIAAGSLDNILKPLLIKRGANISLLLIMTGVIGGMLAWGMIGLMIGPVLLAVSWTLLSAWVRNATSPPDTVNKSACSSS